MATRYSKHFWTTQIRIATSLNLHDKEAVHLSIHPFIHSLPRPSCDRSTTSSKRTLQRMPSSTSSFKIQCLLFSLRSHSSCLRNISHCYSWCSLPYTLLGWFILLLVLFAAVGLHVKRMVLTVICGVYCCTFTQMVLTLISGVYC